MNLEKFIQNNTPKKKYQYLWVFSRYLKKPKKQNIKEVKNININESKNSMKDKIEKKPIDIFANLKTKDSKTSLEQTMLDFVKDLKW